MIGSCPGMYKLHCEFVRKQCSLFDQPNSAFSPHNLDTVMAMLYMGSAGRTAEQLCHCYFAGRSPTDVVEALDLSAVRLYGASGKSGSEVGQGLTLDMASRLFLDSSVTATEYSEILRKYFYEVPTDTSDFRGNAEKERGRINQFIEQGTRGKITNLLPPSSITADARVVVAAALYFKGQWAKQFQPLQNRVSEDAVFHAIHIEERAQTVSAVHNVKYMELITKCTQGGYCFGYHEHNSTEDGGGIQHGGRPLSGSGCRILEIPYKDADISMVLVIPDDPLKLGDYETQWSSDCSVVEEWIAKGSSAENKRRLTSSGKHTIRLPYFSITPDTLPGSIDVQSACRTIGVIDLFDRSLCDLGHIDATAKDLFVSGIFHMCTVDVDEKGTEAAAATAAVFSVVCVEEAGLTICVDRPFMFQIRLRRRTNRAEEEHLQHAAHTDGPKEPFMERKSDLVLFMGRVGDISKLNTAS
eukprot:GHVQ01013090.1.p1 GENE.GHVQ01013090.1~~GHVQ01013090.1.p1  ORF type:complete len:470 (-),score=55.73 GHVQ01013090.1:50-1459(-)